MGLSTIQIKSDNTKASMHEAIEASNLLGGLRLSILPSGDQRQNPPEPGCKLLLGRDFLPFGRLVRMILHLAFIFDDLTIDFVG